MAELPSQTGPEPEPDVASPSRTEREPTKPMLDVPGSELVPLWRGPEPDRTSPSRTEREPYTLRTGAGTGPTTELSDWARAGPEQDQTCWDCRQAEGNQQGRGTQSRRSCPMGPDSDGFIMNRLEEGALGDPVLAGNLVYNLDGRLRHS